MAPAGTQTLRLGIGVSGLCPAADGQVGGWYLELHCQASQRPAHSRSVSLLPEASTESRFASVRQRLEKLDADSKEARSLAQVAGSLMSRVPQSVQAQLGQVAVAKDLQVVAASASPIACTRWPERESSKRDQELESLRGRLGAAEQQQAHSLT